MADQFSFQQTQLQNPNAPQTAFGDYSYGASLARAADTVGQVSQILKQKQTRRSLVRFQLDNRETVDKLKKKDLSSAEFLEEYTNYFEESVGAFDEDMQQELKANIYYRTIDSPDFQRHVADLEASAVDELWTYTVDTFTNKWTTGEPATAKELGEFYEAVDTMEFPSEEAKRVYERQASEVEETALLNADSMEEFDAMVSSLRYADKNPTRIKAMRDSLERDLQRLSTAVSSRNSADIADALSRAKDPSIKQTMADIIDVQPHREAGTSEDDIRRIYEHNFIVSMLKSRAFWNPDYFEKLSDPQEMETQLIKAGFSREDVQFFLRDKESIGSFQRLAEYYRDLPPAVRIQDNPEVAKYFDEGNIAQGLNNALEFMGDPPEGTPDEMVPQYMGLDNTKIMTSMIPPDALKEYIRNVDPTNADAQSIIAYRNQMEGQFGRKWKNAFNTALVESLMKGLNGVQKNPRLAAYLSASQWVVDDGIDFLYQGYTDSDSADRMIKESGKPQAELDTRIDTMLFESEFMGVFKDAMKGYGNDVSWTAFEDLVRDAVYARADGKVHKISQAAQDIKDAFSLRFHSIRPEGMQNSFIPIPKEFAIDAHGPLDSARDIVANIFAGDERDSPIYNDSFQKYKWEDTFRQATWNPLQSMPLRAIQEGAVPAGIPVIQDIFTAASNVGRAVSRKARKGAADRPFTIYQPAKFYWEGAPDDNAQQMYRRLMFKGWGAVPQYRVEMAWGPNGEPGVRFYGPSKSLDGKNVSEDEAIYDVPLIDRSTGDPAFISFGDLGVPDQ